LPTRNTRRENRNDFLGKNPDSPAVRQKESSFALRSGVLFGGTPVAFDVV